MRLDRLHPTAWKADVEALLARALREQGRTHWTAIRTSFADGVQVGIKVDPARGRLVVYFRRPRGPEDFRELAAVLQALGVDPKAGQILQASGKGFAPHGWGPRRFLVALVPLEGVGAMREEVGRGQPAAVD